MSKRKNGVLHEVFKSLLPNNSINSFDYQLNQYMTFSGNTIQEILSDQSSYIEDFKDYVQYVYRLERE